MSKHFARLLAHVVFDGWLRKHAGSYIVGYSNKSSKLISEFLADLRQFSDRKVYKRKRKSGVNEVEVCDRHLWQRIKRYMEKSSDDSQPSRF